MTINLRELLQHDYLWIYYACQEPDILKYTTMGDTFSFNDAMDYVINNKDYEEETWVITKNNLPIGLISKHSYLNEEKTIYNVGYWIMKSERKKGYGKIALELLYQKLKPNKYSFLLEIAPSNIASINTAKSLGFYIIGSKRGLSIYSK